jgi:purine-binding chemotaxis protein CheW
MSTQESDRYLIFELTDEHFAVPLLQVREVIAHKEPTPIPNSPTFVKGMIQLRDQVITIVDLAQKMNLKRKHPPTEATIIIVDFNDKSVGFLVDNVHSVAEFLTSDLSPTSEVYGSTSSQYLKGVFRHDKQLILLLDLKSTDQIEKINPLPPKLGSSSTVAA